MVNILPKWDIGIISNSVSTPLESQCSYAVGAGEGGLCQEHDPAPVQN